MSSSRSPILGGLRQAKSVILGNIPERRRKEGEGQPRLSRGYSRKVTSALMPHPQHGRRGEGQGGPQRPPPTVGNCHQHSYFLPREQALGGAGTNKKWLVRPSAETGIKTIPTKGERKEAFPELTGRLPLIPILLSGPQGPSGVENGNPVTRSSRPAGLKPPAMTLLLAAGAFLKHFQAFRGCFCHDSTPAAPLKAPVLGPKMSNPAVFFLFKFFFDGGGNF